MGDSSERAEPLLISCSVKAERKQCRTTNRAETCSHVRCRPIADNADFAELIAMTPSEAFNLAASLVGQPISHVWQGYGSALFIGLAAYGRSPNAMARPATRKPRCRWGSNGDGGLSPEPNHRSRHDRPGALPAGEIPDEGHAFTTTVLKSKAYAVPGSRGRHR